MEKVWMMNTFSMIKVCTFVGMKRSLYQKLLIWKKSTRRKPLLLQGARQVGKTWLMQRFGQTEYEQFVYFNLEQQADARSLFLGDLSPDKLLHNMSLLLGQRIDAQRALICLDEIQVVPEAITSLKYFQEQAPEVHLMAAGSLLGVQVGKTSSFPVGKVNFMTLYPLSFPEFLAAMGEELLVEEMRQSQRTNAYPEAIHQKGTDLLKLFLYLGGMPEIVDDYLQHKDIAAVRQLQLDILEAYTRDFSKYSVPRQAMRIQEIWQSIPYQLARENKKFKYKDVREKARASQYEQSITWLSSAGLIHPAYALRTPKFPLSGYADYSKFKLYLLDTGLLGAMLNLTSDLVVQPNTLFTEYNGAFIENYVANELRKAGQQDLFYWTSRGTAEVDFILQREQDIVPLEVKSGSSRNTKSLRSYAEKYNPPHLYRTSPRNFTTTDDFTNVPCYALGAGL